MTAYAAMLRGVNVGGRAKVSMSDLRAAFVDMGFGDARTYIQSGNVVFGASTSADRLTSVIEENLEARFGLGIKVVLRTGAQLAHTIGHNPFVVSGRDPAKLYVTFLTTPPAAARLSALATRAFLPDEFQVAGSDIFLHCPDGYGRTKINNAFFERALGLTATTRSWRSVTTLAAMAG